jgi:hypothetical protein
VAAGAQSTQCECSLPMAVSQPSPPTPTPPGLECARRAPQWRQFRVRVRVSPGDEVSLKGYVAQGPVLALIDAGQPSFNLYTSGVYSEPACRTQKPTRAVLIVGCGTIDGQDYWLVKNSIGTSWCAAGYIFMSRNNNNNCGIASFALAVSNDPLPPPTAPAIPAIPMLSARALGFLLFGFSALGFLTLRRHSD